MGDDKWIAIDIEYPKERTNVEIYYHYLGIDAIFCPAHYTNRNGEILWSFNNYILCGDVSHWRIPAPPEVP